MYLKFILKRAIRYPLSLSDTGIQIASSPDKKLSCLKKKKMWENKKKIKM